MCLKYPHDKDKRMKKVLFLFFFLFSVLFALQGADKDKPKDKIILRGEKAGDVTFTHLKHTQIPNSKCTDCHHKFEPPNDYKACRSCHGIRADLSKPGKVFHKTCIECHNTNKQNPKIPRRCKGCHAKID